MFGGSATGGRSRLGIAGWCCRPKETILMASRARYLLLKDVHGFKLDGTVKSVIKKTIGGDPYSVTNVLRGQLVEEAPLPDLNMNMRLCRDHSIVMYTKPEDMAPLNPEEFSLMEAIDTPSDRLHTFDHGKLELGMNLDQGSKVFVALYGPGNVKTKYVRATVQYKGQIQGFPGTMFGVEIQQSKPDLNCTDGTHHGKRYFVCENGFGMFVSLSKLSPYQEGVYHKQHSSSSLKESIEMSSFSDTSDTKDPPSSNTRSKAKMSESSVDCSSKIKEDDHVIFYDKHGNTMKGTVKWMGNKTVSRKFNFTVVGIYTNDEVYQTDYERSIPGLSHLIAAPKNRSLFIPEAMVDKVVVKKENVTPKQEEVEQSITSIIANTDKKSKDEVMREQHRILEEVSHNKMKEEFAHAVKEEDFQEQLQQMQKFEEEKLKQRREQQEKGTRSTQQTFERSDREHRDINQKGGSDYYHPGTYSSDGRSIETTLPHEDYGGNRANASCGEGPLYNFDTGSLVQIPLSNETQGYMYGVIRWIGEIPKANGIIAGIELEDFMEGCTDGKWTDPDGGSHQFFRCSYGRGLYYPLNRIQPDSRYSVQKHHDMNPLADVPETVPSGINVAVDTDIMHYVGEKKGIQGHQNSCYLDATVFGLFALSEDFDEMFLRDTDSRVGKILWQKIVNPLRRYGVVKYESIMELRKELERLGKMSGITSDEKDPEEFLNLMFKHSLKVEPFISIRRPFGVEPEYFVQLFLELNDSNKPAQIGHLLTKMFKEQSISFTQVPSKLLIQVPRHGKKFQSFQKIIPDIELDISAVTDSIHSGNCFFCEEEKAVLICQECYKNFGSQSVMAYCKECYSRSHKHSRKNHHPQTCETGESKLDLLSVLCIETSHYVCFTRRDKRWLFFDSMSNRLYDKYNIPRVDDCSKELNEWVYPNDNNTERLVRTQPRELPECVRRFTQDIYLCVYVQAGFSMY